MILNEFFSVDLENEELQFKTKSSLGSQHVAIVMFFTSLTDTAFVGNFRIRFSDPMVYIVGSCSKNSQGDIFDKPPAITTTTIWRIAKDKNTGLLVWCNDQLVLTYLFETAYQSGCAERYAQDVEKIKFRNDDTASDSYRVSNDVAEGD